MSFQGERAVRNGFGQLPDLMGTIIPGAGNLSPRHPVKITAAMFALGILSGWVSVLAAAVLGSLFQMEHWLAAGCSAAGLCFGCIVLVPWCCWTDRGRGWALLWILYATVINFLGFYYVQNQIDESLGLGFFLLGAVWSAALGGLGMYLQRRGSVGWLLAMSVSLGFCYLASIKVVSLDVVQETLSNYFDTPVHMIMMLGWFLSACHACTAVWLGSLLWDQRVKLTFEALQELS